MSHRIKCWKCKGRTDVTALEGARDNLCAHCGAPVHAATFGELDRHAVFMAESGVTYVKISGDSALCVSTVTGRGLQIGKSYPAISDLLIYPY